MENVSEVKLAKFETMLKETCYWFYAKKPNMSIENTILGNGYAAMPFCLPILDDSKLDNYLNNPYIKQVYDVCFLSNSEIRGPQVNKLGQTMMNLRKSQFCACQIFYEANSGIMGLMQALLADKPRVSEEKVDFDSYKIRGGMIFWALLIATIDESFYNNEINMISDLAYMLGFTEDMMSDWVAAVKYLLDGNRFSETMPLEFKTPEANKFFKHK